MPIKDVSSEWINAILKAQELYVLNEYNLEKTHEMFLSTDYRLLWEEVRGYIEPHSDGKLTITDGTIDQPEPWYDDPKEGDSTYWTRYLDLLYRKGWHSAINPISSSTRDLIDRIPNPNGSEMDVYGMVVGRVQSGKTANFTALISRAVDSGYNLVIVMSGTLNNLRDQTQIRLLRELTGDDDHPRGLSVETPEDDGDRFNLLTYRGDIDFQGADLQFLYGERPMLAVVKKDDTVLKKLYDWLKQASKGQRANLKLLMIDDECDYGSVNTNRKKPIEEELIDDDESDWENSAESEDEKSASITNAYVRGILNLFPTRAYVGYTATPYANVMIDPHEDGACFDLDNSGDLIDLGKTLYPRNFIKLLDKPRADSMTYVGLDEIFPSFGALNHVEEVSDVEASLVRGEVGTLDRVPIALKNALADYIISGSIKRANSNPKDWRLTHHTMIIHVGQGRPQMKPIALEVEALLDEWRNALFDTSNPDHEDILETLRESWYRFSDDPFLLDEVLRFLVEVKETILLNSEDDKSIEKVDLDPYLDFDSSVIRSVIVGGNLLSRGLTVEGLTTSYFVRPAGTYDAAIQMCRWNGMRKLAETELTRVYLTRELRENYQFLKTVEEDLREDIRQYVTKNLTPSDFAVRVLMHKVEEKNRRKMKPTSGNKMAAVVKVDRGIQRTIKQARGFHLDDPEKLRDNVELVENFFDKIELIRSEDTHGGENGNLIASDVGLEEVWRLIQELKFPERGFAKEGILGYFKHMRSFRPNNLENWTVVVVGNGEGSVLSISPDLEIKMPYRATTVSLGIGELVSSKNLSIDLQGYPEDFRGDDKTFPRSLMWDARDNFSPLLLLYLLDPLYGEGMLLDQHQMSPSDIPKFVVAPALVIPDVNMTKKEKADLLAYYRLEGMEGSGR